MTTEKFHDANPQAGPASDGGHSEGALQDVQTLVFRTLIGIMPDRIYAKDLQGRFILANHAVANLMGKRTPEEMLGRRTSISTPRNSRRSTLRSNRRCSVPASP